MKRPLLLFILIFLGAFHPRAWATYEHEESRGESHAGAGAAVGILTALLQQSLQKEEEEKEPEPPPVVTVVEVPADEELKGPCHAEVEVEHPDKKEPYVFDVQIYIPPSAADAFACCEMRSLEFVNRWQHPLEFRVEKAPGKVVGPGESIRLEGKWGECVRVTALSHGQQGKTGEHLVIEDQRFCCNELRTKGAGRFTAMQLVDFSLEEKTPPCKQAEEFQLICCEACPGRLGDRFYSPLPPDTECQPGDIRHDELVFGEKDCANPMLEPQYYPGPIIPNPACPYKEEGSCPPEYRPCSAQPRACFEGFVDKCIQTETCRYACCQCVPETTTTTTTGQCPSDYNACGSPAECGEGMKQECTQTETCEKPCCRCVPETVTKDQCPAGYNPCGSPAECGEGMKQECTQTETCEKPCCRCVPETVTKDQCPAGYNPCGDQVACAEGSTRQCVRVESCPDECCKCEPKTKDQNYCPDDYPPCGTPAECPEGFTPDCVQVSTCPEACCRCVPAVEENYCPAGYPPCGTPPPVCPDRSVLQCIQTAACPEKCCKCVPVDDDEDCPPGYPPCGTVLECPESFTRHCIKVPACPEECCKCEPSDKRSCPPGFGPCTPDPIQCPPDTVKECVPSPDCPYDCCRCVKPPPPPCDCSCDLTDDLDPYQPIEGNLVSPAETPEPLRIPLRAQLPLVANASDTDLLKLICEKTSRGGDHCEPPCASEDALVFPINAEYGWEIVQGEGVLVSDPAPPLAGAKTAAGPATIYVAPSHLPPDPRVRIELTLSDDSRHRRNAPDGSQKIEVRFELTDEIEKVEIPFGSGKPPWADAPKPPPSDCSCRPEKEWEVNGGLSGPDGEERYVMCAGHHLVLSNWAKDGDEYTLRCSDPECGRPEKKDAQDDPILYRWAASAGAIIGESDKIVFRAPAEAGRVRVSRSASDSGMQARDGGKDFAPVTIDVIKVDLQAEGIKEEDEITRGALVAYNKDNDDFNAAGAVFNYDPDREQNEVAGEDDLKEVVLDIQMGEVNEGEVRFEIAEGADGENAKLKVWDSLEKRNPVLNGTTRVKSWSAAEFKALPQPVRFYVEGFNRSDKVKDAELRLIYARQAGAEPMCLDRIKYTVFELLLDADRDDALTDDNSTYLPGYDSAGRPRIAAPAGEHLTRLIAAPLNEKVADIARFVIFQTTNFHGMAMNRGNIEDNDYSFEAGGDILEKAAEGFADDRARMDFFVRDYGGESRQEVALARDGIFLASAELRVPFDTDRDHLPDVWERQYAGFDPRNRDTDGDGRQDGAEDDDATPVVTGAPAQGLTGDGLAAREEYRGFFHGEPDNTGHRHYRTAPDTKDLFIHSTVSEGVTNLGIAHLHTANLPLRAYRINGEEWLSRSTKQINFNALPETMLQRALDLDVSPVIDPTLFGLAYPGGIDTGANGVCETPAVPDDSQVIPIGRGNPGSVIITAGRNGYLEILLGGDDVRDGHLVRTGPDGILNTVPHPDDAPVFLQGQGEANRLMIRPGPGEAALKTPHASGDDVLGGNQITTGPNGIAETAAAEGDEQVIAVGRGDPNTVGIRPGANGILDPVRAGDDELSGDVITSGVDGIANTAALAGDDQKIPVGQGEPHALCVRRGSLNNYERKSVPVPDDEAQDTAANRVNESPNEHATLWIYIPTFHNIFHTFGSDGIWQGGPGAPGSDDVDVDLMGAANQARRHDWIRKTMTHEGGHGIHINHYRPPAAPGHAVPWSVMRSGIWGLAAPANYDATDGDQRRLHLKH